MGILETAFLRGDDGNSNEIIDFSYAGSACGTLFKVGVLKTTTS